MHFVPLMRWGGRRNKRMRVFPAVYWSSGNGNIALKFFVLRLIARELTHFVKLRFLLVFFGLCLKEMRTNEGCTFGPLGKGNSEEKNALAS